MNQPSDLPLETPETAIDPSLLSLSLPPINDAELDALLASASASSGAYTSAVQLTAAPAEAVWDAFLREEWTTGGLRTPSTGYTESSGSFVAPSAVASTSTSTQASSLSREISLSPPLVSPNYASDDARWAATLSRERSADGHFVYCVLSTKIYCRPSCSSRRPKREQVVFHPAPAAAAAAGFRSCKRCKPDEAGLDPARKRQEEVVERAKAIMREKIKATGNGVDAMPSLAALAKSVGMSAWHFHRVFKAKEGCTPDVWGKRLKEGRRGPS